MIRRQTDHLRKDETMSDNNNDIPDFLMGGSPAPPKKDEPKSDSAPETPAAPVEEEASSEAEPAAAADAPEAPEAQEAEPVAEPVSRDTEVTDLAALGGILSTDDSEVDQSELDQFDVDSSIPEASGKLGAVFLGIAVVLLVGGIGVIATDDSLMEDINCFFSGNIQTCKEEDKLAQERQWAKEDGLLKNQYGELMGMIYTPPNARVTMTQLQWKETKDEFLSRVDKGGADMRGEPSRKDIPNQSHKLKENEKVDSLDFPVLPIQEKDENDENVLYTYAYEVDISKDLYFDRKFLLASKDQFPGDPPQDRQVLWFSELGPGQLMIQWNGCDLAPRPELKRPDYVKAMVRENCDAKTPEGKRMLRDEETWEDHKRDIRAEYGFRTDAEWMDVETALKGNTELWPEIEKEIAEMDCAALATE